MLSEKEKRELIALEDEIARRRARENLLDFVSQTMPEFRASWHHRLMATALEGFAKGTVKKLIITCPPRHGKSQLLSRHLPAWMFGRDPDIRILAASYAATLAESFNRDVQRIITSERYREIFPETRLNEKNIVSTAQGSYLRNSQVFEVVGRRGTYRCAGIGGSLTGAGGDRLICDDYLRDWKDAMSPTIRNSQWDWYRAVFMTRLQKGGGIAMTVTRWSDDDIIGRLLSLPDAKEWEVIELPAILDETAHPDYDPRELGEALWPDEFPLEVLAERRATLGTRIFEALYQQRPSPGEGDVVKREWWRYYTKASLPNDLDVYISADLTLKDKEKSDFTVYQVWGKNGADKYLLQQVRDRMGSVKQLSVLRALAIAYEPLAVYIEDAANGAAIVDLVRRTISGVLAVPPRGSKQARLEAVAPQIQAGNVFLPDPSESLWVNDYVEEFAVFPAGKNDDQVDATSLALSKLGKSLLNADFAPINIKQRSTWDL